MSNIYITMRYLLLGLLWIWSLPIEISSSANTIANAGGGLDFEDDSSQSQSQRQRRGSSRRIAIGDFDELNQILLGAVLRIPDTTFNSDGATLRLSNAKCKRLTLGDLTLHSRQPSLSSIEVTLQLTDLDMVCTANYQFSAWWLFGGGGSGTADITSNGNDASIGGTISSIENSPHVPPEEIFVRRCNPTVHIDEVNFSNGGLFGKILNIFRGLLGDFMESQARDAICDQLRSVMEDAEGLLRHVKLVLDEYKPDADSVGRDPLLAKATLDIWGAMIVEDTKILLDFRDTTTNFANWFQYGLNQAEAYLTSLALDPRTGGTTYDMQANILLRQHVLQQSSGALEIESADLSSDVVYESHNPVTRTQVHFDSVRMVGLDTLHKLQPLDVIGDYTLQNQLSWEYLGFEIQATIEMMPSTLSNSIIESSTSTVRMLEKVAIFVGLNEVDAELSILSLIDQNLLREIQLGQVLDVDNILPCLLSTILHADITSLSVDVADVLTPSMTGFVSPGMDRLFSSTMDAGFLMYEHIVLDAAPQFFQERVRPILSDAIVKKAVSSSDNSVACAPRPTWSGLESDRRIDFRDLLLSPLDAKSAGATGREPYGNIFSSYALPYLKENVFQGELFNEGFVRPFTHSRSGAEGSIVFSETLLGWNHTTLSSVIYDSLVVSVSELRIDNLDTVVDPMRLLHPVDVNVLSNTLAFGGSPEEFGDKNLTITIRIALAINGKDSLLEMQNTVDLSISIPSSILSLDVLANLRESSVMEFSIFDLTNVHCWIVALDDSLAKSLSLLALSLDISSFELASDCVTCSSPGVHFLSDIIQTLENNGFNSLYKDAIVSFFVDLILDYSQVFDIEYLIHAAPKRCPHHLLYDHTVGGIKFPWPDLPPLRKGSDETVVAMGMIALHCAMVVGAKNQLLLEGASALSPMDEVINVALPTGSGIVNWTNIGEDFGDWAAIAFGELQKYLNGTLIKPTVSNRMLASQVTDAFQSGTYTVNFNDVEFEGLGFGAKLIAVKLDGLDVITAVEALVPISPHILGNKIELKTLLVTFEVEANSKSGESELMTISYELEDVVAQVDISLAMDLNLLGDVQLGSIFDMNNQVPCAIRGIRHLELPKLNFVFKNVRDPVIDGYFSEENEERLQFIHQTLFGMYRLDLVKATPLLFDSILRNMANSMIPEILTSQQCPPPKNYPDAGIIDFRDLFLSENVSTSLGGSGESLYGDLFQRIYDVMQDTLLQTGPSGRPMINELLQGLTDRLSNIAGSLLFQGNIIEKGGRISIAGLDASFGVVVSNVSVVNIDSVGVPFDILRPIMGEAHIPNNTLSFGVDSRPLEVRGNIILSLSDDVDIQMRNEMEFTISLENVVVVASFLMKLSEMRLSSFPLRDMTNIHCWLSAIFAEGLSLVHHSISTKHTYFDINCIDCTSPFFDEMILSLYNDTSNAIDTIQENTDSLLDAGFVEAFVDYTVDNAVSKCPHRPEFNPTKLDEELLLTPEKSLGLLPAVSVEKPPYFTVIYSIIAGFAFVFGILCKGIVDCRNKKWRDSLSHNGQFHLKSQQEKEKHIIETLNENTTSLFMGACIPRRVRYGIPLALALNLALLLGAHSAVLSTINVDATLAGEQFAINNFMQFSFGETLRNASKVGGAEMVALLWIFAVVWPYTKVVLSLAMWVATPKRLSVMNRGRILLWIDAAAKLSVIDIATVIIGFALLLVFIGGPDESYVNDDMLYSLKAIVVPGPGFYCMLIAQRISRVSSKLFLEYHEEVIKNAAKTYLGKIRRRR
mmetsp:Transcript_20470/g.37295  ORF Transcript_20470/g.37295 Transcript_20470/m.37295 type:complete len:1773 (+) Transcript_20470:127-5445(+)